MFVKVNMVIGLQSKVNTALGHINRSTESIVRKVTHILPFPHPRFNPRN